MSFKRVLVTGGAGFIGSNFIRYMLNKYKDIEIINFDKLTYAGNLDNLKDIESDKRYKFVKGDICDEKEVEKTFSSKIDAVVNFAAETHVDRSISNPDDFIKTDIFGTFVLLEASRKHIVKKFIQISTDEVYGSTEGDAFKETDPLMPSSPYAASKAGADRLAYSYFVTYNVPVTIIRASNNFGPYQYPEKLIPLFVTNALENKQLPLYGDGKNVRDWLYVIDHCEAIDFVMNNGENGEVYNVGGGNERSNIQITEFILKTTGKGKDLIKFVADRLGHDKRYALNSSKLSKLGWEPKHTFEEAMKETVEWYMNNQNWWKKIKSGEYKEYYKNHYKVI